MTAFERQVLVEMNLARTDPSGYARHIERQVRYFDGSLLRLPGEVALRTTEGAKAVREAAAALRGQSPLPALAASRGLSRAARDHVEDQGPRGRLGHSGSDGSDMTDRIERYGTWDGSVAENISYGSTTARDVVIGLLVDDGVPSRGHRANILSAKARFAGVACGRHTTYGTMCVIDFAGEYREARGASPSGQRRLRPAVRFPFARGLAFALTLRGALFGTFFVAFFALFFAAFVRVFFPGFAAFFAAGLRTGAGLSECTPKAASCGSVPVATRSPPGTSAGPNVSVPPALVAASPARSALATRMYGSHCAEPG
jgi:uncharacterized protein YkwD